MEIRPALAPYVPLARMLAQTFGQDCEVVLHDLDCPEHSVVHVENPSVTGRKVGQSFDQLVRQVILSNELKEDFVANYYFTAPNGKRIRSSTLLIRDGDGRLTGALCLNLDTTRLTQQIAYLQSLPPQPRDAGTGAARAADRRGACRGDDRKPHGPHHRRRAAAHTRVPHREDPLHGQQGHFPHEGQHRKGGGKACC